MLARGISIGKLLIGGILAVVISAGLILLIAPLVAAEIAGGSSYQIDDAAMQPTLEVGDWVLAEALPAGETPPRGAIVGYASPVFEGEYDVRRVIGLPGERVQMRGGAVYIDGQRAGMERLDDRVILRRPPALRTPLPLCINDPVKIDGECRQEQWRETLPDGFSEVVLNTRGRLGAVRFRGTPTGDDTPVMIVPQDAVFVLGDNRDVSIDSRSQQYGMVPIAKIRHRVWMIHSSIDKSTRLFHPRLARFFRRVE